MSDEDESASGSRAEKAGAGGIVPPVASRWKPGVSPNPGGRPKGSSPSDALRKFSGKSKKQLARINRENLTMIELGVLQLLIETATKATLKNMEFFSERLDGKVPQATVEISLTPAQAQAMTDDEIRDLLRR